eukprot:9493445-Alexandrium_andersonii.AAC.1
MPRGIGDGTVPPGSITPCIRILTTPAASARRTASLLPPWTGSSRGVAPISRSIKALRSAGG